MVFPPYITNGWSQFIELSWVFLNSKWGHSVNFFRKLDFGLTTALLLSQAISRNLKNSTPSYKIVFLLEKTQAKWRSGEIWRKKTWEPKKKLCLVLFGLFLGPCVFLKKIAQVAIHEVNPLGLFKKITFSSWNTRKQIFPSYGSI